MDNARVESKIADTLRDVKREEEQLPHQVDALIIALESGDNTGAEHAIVQSLKSIQTLESTKIII